jgi:hypothetical protein
VPLDHPGEVPAGPEVTVALAEGNHCHRVMRWPDRQMRYLAFVAGSADEVPAAALG